MRKEMSEEQNISPNDQQLKQYINQQLNADELHEFEMQMADSNMLNDAVEGLQAINNKKNIDVYVNDLNKHLQQYTQSKKKRRLKNLLQLSDWTLLAIILIIALCVITYFIISKMKGH